MRETICNWIADREPADLCPATHMQIQKGNPTRLPVGKSSAERKEEGMFLYTIVDIREFMGSKEAFAVFSRKEMAEEFVRTLNRRDFPDIEIERHKVIGDYEYPNMVYAAHEYHAEKDIHYFKGLYSDHGTAKHEAGKGGYAKNLEPDSRLKGKE